MTQFGQHPEVKDLVQQHVGRVYRFALRLTGDRHLAEDLTQDTFAKAWQNRRRLRQPEAARAWLFRIAVNLWRDRLRQKRRRPKSEEIAPDDCLSEGKPPDGELVDREDLQRTLDAMDLLPERQREVLYLHACEELSLAEIGNILDISPDAAKASLSLARKRMRRLVADVYRDRFSARSL